MTTIDPIARLLANEHAIALHEGITRGLCEASAAIRANEPDDRINAYSLYHNITAAIHALIDKELAAQAAAWPKV